MEKIITVKQEPIDDAYPTPPSTTSASVTTTVTTTATVTVQNVTTKTTTAPTLATGTITSVAAAAGSKASEPQIFFIQPKPELNKTPCSVGAVAQGKLGTLLNYNSDSKQNVKKAISLMSKTTTLLVHHAFLYIKFSLLSLHSYDVKWPSFKFT